MASRGISEIDLLIEELTNRPRVEPVAPPDPVAVGVERPGRNYDPEADALGAELDSLIQGALDTELGQTAFSKQEGEVIPDPQAESFDGPEMTTAESIQDAMNQMDSVPDPTVKSDRLSPNITLKNIWSLLDMPTQGNEAARDVLQKRVEEGRPEGDLRMAYAPVEDAGAASEAAPLDLKREIAQLNENYRQMERNVGERSPLQRALLGAALGNASPQVAGYFREQEGRKHDRARGLFDQLKEATKRYGDRDYAEQLEGTPAASSDKALVGRVLGPDAARGLTRGAMQRLDRQGLMNAITAAIKGQADIQGEEHKDYQSEVAGLADILKSAAGEYRDRARNVRGILERPKPSGGHGGRGGSGRVPFKPSLAGAGGSYAVLEQDRESVRSGDRETQEQVKKRQISGMSSGQGGGYAVATEAYIKHYRDVDETRSAAQRAYDTWNSLTDDEKESVVAGTNKGTSNLSQQRISAARQDIAALTNKHINALYGGAVSEGEMSRAAADNGIDVGSAGTLEGALKYWFSTRGNADTGKIGRYLERMRSASTADLGLLASQHPKAIQEMKSRANVYAQDLNEQKEGGGSSWVQERFGPDARMKIKQVLPDGTGFIYTVPGTNNEKAKGKALRYLYGREG